MAWSTAQRAKITQNSCLERRRQSVKLRTKGGEECGGLVLSVPRMGCWDQEEKSHRETGEGPRGGWGPCKGGGRFRKVGVVTLVLRAERLE